MPRAKTFITLQVYYVKSITHTEYVGYCMFGGRNVLFMTSDGASCRGENIHDAVSLLRQSITHTEYVDTACLRDEMSCL